MLEGGSNASEFSVAGLAFGPVIIVVKVCIELVLVRELLVAIVTFVHCDGLREVAGGRYRD